MEVGDEVFARVVEHAADVKEGRQLQDAVGVENVGFPHPRAHFDVDVEEVVINEAPRAIAAQRLLVK